MDTVHRELVASGSSDVRTIIDSCAPGLSSQTESHEVDVSVIIPVYNADKWLEECLNSVAAQEFVGTLEVSVYNDSSTDRSADILKKWAQIFHEKTMIFTLGTHIADGPRGVGYAKNKAVKQSHGRYLCFLDADDVMNKSRVQRQWEAARDCPTAIIGSRFHREPEWSTERYTNWANGLTEDELLLQVYTSHGPTVIMPTWFCSRAVYDQVGGFDESGKGTPEDLIFFYAYLRLGGDVRRVDQDLVMYRYHPEATTFSVKEETIWKLRVKFLQERVLDAWSSFTIWNAGKQGRQLFRALEGRYQKKVVRFCDVDAKKISKGVYTYEETSELPKPKIPIVHFTDATPPLVICVKMDLTGGNFESNLKSLNLKEGTDYVHFN